MSDREIIVKVSIKKNGKWWDVEAGCELTEDCTKCRYEELCRELHFAAGDVCADVLMHGGEKDD